ncbi:T9SS type A sorting domain-containing protein [Cytophaga hutchinsonii]|uniref:Secretion system C-terminal sorting domain-containing protein n=1 Tax=Cytophaga hutchinsonii (strain ATCC 33406 / DSM 1761 / CIP 103989 / NBRC 15051 / NCIMB 9469 / D465) TaxID=269798 RepID=A0A6N4SVE2_CYTH3|nr:T9SS type A sorting domain-containing protein [Cytophaga hutchinsonii]ABG60523.1 conserved hypothetical protein [Cytophaga hutchinsonii ATCC 33406]SFX90746.1 Por secretion system C-terminal sorting domain-containing protein [Cytophaga hutchinsonii ATCC 33406]
MKKLLWLLFCSFGVMISSTAQQQVWKHSGYNSNGYQIRNIASINNKIIYLASSIEMQNVYAVTGNENRALLLDEFSEVSNFTVFGDKVVFCGRKDYISTLWITDGTLQGTVSLTGIQNLYATNIAIFNNKIYFTNGNSIYYTDGTLNSVQLLLTVPADENETPSVRPIIFLKALQDKLIYYYYGQLGVTDGTSSTIKFLSDNATSTLIIGAYVTADVVNNKLIFINASADIGFELWSTDGTDANTALLKDINPGTLSSFEEENHNLRPWFTSSNGKLYFVANKGTGKSVWVTDGTLNGTSELNMGARYYNPENLKSIDGNVYFTGSGLCFSDGLNNTVQNIAGVQNPNYAYGFIKFDGSVYFVASDADHGYELWKTENTASSTTRVTDICAGTCGSFNSNTGLAVCWNILFFSASDIAPGYNEVDHSYGPEYQLWKLEGSSVAASTRDVTVPRVNAYPNPCKEYVSIEFQQPVSNVKIISAVGSEVDANWQQDSNTLRVQAHALNPGMYMLLINGKESVRIIKE